MSVFSNFSVLEWLLFGFGFLMAFGLLNGLYRISRLFARGSLPIYLWVFNGVVAVLIAATFAQRLS